MKFGELIAVLGRSERAFVKVRFDGDDDIDPSVIDADGVLGNLLKDYEVAEMLIVKGTVCLKLKEAGA